MRTAVAPDGPTINDVLDHWVSVRSKTVAEPTDLASVVAPCRRHLGDWQAADADQVMVDTYTAARVADGVQPQTARRELTALWTGLRMVAKTGAIPPVKQVTLPPPGRARQRYLTPKETQRLMAVITEPRLRLFVAIALATGARRQAICNLTWDRVDLERGMIDFRAPHPRAERRKGRAITPISPTLVEMLAVVRPTNGAGSVIRISAHAVAWNFTRARDRAGLGPEVTPHVLRHTAASIMVKSVPLVVASRMLGHANTTITESVYVHHLADDLRPAAEATAALLPASTGALPPPPSPPRLGSIWRRLLRRHT